MTIAQVLQYKGFRVGPDLRNADAVVVNNAIEQWGPTSPPRPGTTTLNAWQNEPGFQTWLAQHGGDPVQTVRREAKEALSRQNEEVTQLIRAVALTMLDEINTLRGQHNLAQRTKAQLNTAISNKIDSGQADTS